MYKSIVRAAWLAGVCLAISLARMVSAQPPNPPTQPGQQVQADQRVQVNLPPAIRGTPLSYQIQGEAQYIAAQGAFLEAAAVARKINAEAVALEIQNSVDYVNAYFERRRLNREWRHKEDKARYEKYLEIEARNQEVMKQKINKYFQDTLRGDVTNELNWLVQNLYFVQYMNKDDLKPLDSPLSKEELEQIYITDGGHAGSKLVFAANDGEMLKTPWPYVLRRSAFAGARKEFEDSRDAVVKEIQANGHAGEESSERILKAVNQLLVTLDTVYSREDRMDPTVFLRYSSAKSFLQSLIVQVNRALNTNDRSVFDGSLRFNGSTLVDLIQHMCKKGLMFDRPQSGGDRVYTILFTHMRNLYLEMVVEKNSGKLPARFN
ncbi:MAG TPA: hypothetical protein VIH42_08015 [Thermoguttaceae bacterium]